jgi:drug/metabolite transporter (DMT)-like permease
MGFFFGHKSIKLHGIVQSEWFLLAIVTGVLFILMFFLLNISTRYAGMAITASANKTSMVIPIAVSIYLEQNGAPSFLKIIALVLGIIAVALMSLKNKSKLPQNKILLFLPIIIFLGAGIIDSIIKIAQDFYISTKLTTSFNVVVFTISAIVGISVNIVNYKKHLKKIALKDVLLGFSLGISNYFSLHFFLETLNYAKYNPDFIRSAEIFSVNNVSIVFISTLLGILLFKERIERINKFGIALSLITLLLISM